MLPNFLANRACSVLQVYVGGIHADIVSIVINSEHLDDKREVTSSMLHFLFVSESIMRPSLVSLSPAWYWSRSAWNVYNKCYILGFVQQDGKGYCLLCWWNRFWTVPVKSLTFLWFPPTGFTRSGEIAWHKSTALASLSTVNETIGCPTRCSISCPEGQGWLYLTG